MRSRTQIGLCTLLFVLFFVQETRSQWSWPDAPKNLQVLPKDFDGARLRPVMTGFTRALGVRCSYCHVGEEGQPLSTYDFVSDDNPNKGRARTMLTMLGDINRHLAAMDKSSDPPVNMWCHTCHRGRPTPKTLEEELGSVYRAQDVSAALAHYSTLKNQYYGKGVFNFGEGSLTSFGYEVLGKGDTDGAIRVFTLYTEQFPESSNAWDSLGEAYLKAGDTKKAKEYYERSLQLNPKNRNAQQMLEKIGKQE